MKVKNMDKYFPFQILRRGYDYYKKGKVKEIIKTKDGFIAKVIGTEEYKVIINANGNQYNMLCSCPYAEDNNCKHMAAVLYCLKNDNLPIKENNKNIEIEEITDFKKFEKEFKKECYKLFRGRNYLNEYEVDDYIDIINSFMKEGTKYIDNNIELAYEIFEFLIMEVDSIDIYDEYNKKVVLFENLFLSYKKIFDNKKIFVRFLAFIGTIYTIDPDECYFVYKREIIDFLCDNIKCKWQAEYIMILFEKMNRDKIIPNYIKENITAKIVYLTYNYINKEEGLRIAKNNLNIKEICDFLLNIYKDNQDKKIELLIKMINVNKKYSNKEYYVKLLSIYEKKDKKKYIDLLNKKFDDYKDIETYHEIKNNYTKNEWKKIRERYIEALRDRDSYIDVCVEEEYYEKAIEKLEDNCIQVINKYLKILVNSKPKETLKLYKKKLIIEIDKSSCRKHYQDILYNFNNLLKIPKGKYEIKNIIKYIRENYKNRKALQEEIDFYEDTYL